MSSRVFFELTIDGNKSRSALLEFKDWIEIEVKDVESGTLLPEVVLHIEYANGIVDIVKSDEAGIVKLNDVPPGRIILEILQNFIVLNG